MNQSSANPYVSPSAEAVRSPNSIASQQLTLLWIWLAIAVVASFLGTPADPLSMFVALGYGLISFCLGAVCGLRGRIVLRGMSLILWIVIAIAYCFLYRGHFFLFVVSSLYGIISFAFGFWVCRRIQYGRLRILLSFSTGYLIGSMLGPLGTVAGAAVGAILAKRSLKMSEELDDG